MKVSEWLGENNKLGADIMQNKYLFSDENGTESFDDWLNRISKGNEEVKQLIIDKKFLFGGRILANRGLAEKGYHVTYSNCYCTEAPEDCLESIFETAQKLARTYSYGGGIGVDLSKLAPAGAKVRNAAKHSSGAISFMDLYSMVTGLISQNGRRGALMISLSCEHPDIEEFIDVKKDLDRVTKANISIRMTDMFMEAAQKGQDVVLKFIREETGEVIERTVNAKQVLMHLAENNWAMAEPGCLFWDRVEGWNLLSKTEDFHFAGTNPCAEEPLPPGGSCLLGSINLDAFVHGGNFDMADFKKTVAIATRVLNEVLDEGLPLHPLQEQRDSVRDWRQIGLGIMGLADCLIHLGIKYGQDCIGFIDSIGRAMINEALQESARLAKEFGPYPKYDEKSVVETPFFAYNANKETRELVGLYGLRNSQLLTIAPTGTISTMIGVSGGVEPIFANYYTRKTESLKGKDEYYKVYTPIVKEYMKANDITDDSELPDYFVTAGTLDYKERIAVQSAWQNHIDAAISSTINVPHEFTVEQVFDLYMRAWKCGLKGVTIFRDGCMRTGILTTDSTESSTETNELKRGEIIQVRNDLIGLKRLVISGCGSLHVEAFFTRDTGELREIFLSKGSAGGCNSFMVGLSRMISVAARGGISLQDIVNQLHSTISCPSFAVRTATKHDTSKGSSCPNAIGYALLEMQKEIKSLLKCINEPETNNETSVENTVSEEHTCPACGNKELNYTNGCVTCPECGWSRCS